LTVIWRGELVFFVLHIGDFGRRNDRGYHHSAAGLNPQDLPGLLPRKIGAFHGLTPEAGCFRMKNPMKMDDWGTLILGHLHIFMSKDF
jgi:predicted phosphodiesterase